MHYTPFFFFFNDTATTDIYTSSHTLSLHDALPISPHAEVPRPGPRGADTRARRRAHPGGVGARRVRGERRGARRVSDADARACDLGGRGARDGRAGPPGEPRGRGARRARVRARAAPVLAARHPGPRAHAATRSRPGRGLAGRGRTKVRAARRRARGADAERPRATRRALHGGRRREARVMPARRHSWTLTGPSRDS